MKILLLSKSLEWNGKAQLGRSEGMSEHQIT